jgi:hypothetical protein
MFSYNLNLSFQSCRILLGIKKYNEELLRLGLTHADDRKAREPLKLWSDCVPQQFSHFVTHARTLSDNGLIEKDNWIITKKGLLVCELLEMEMTDFNKMAKGLPVKKTKRLAHQTA